MYFWRNPDRSRFDGDGSGGQHLDRALDTLEASHSAVLPAAVQHVLDSLPWARFDDPAGFTPQGGWAVQEVCADAAAFRASFVYHGVHAHVLGRVIGGGIDVLVRGGNGLRGELALYYHRLVCTNGMVEPLERAARIEAGSLDEWIAAVDRQVPRILPRLRRGFRRLERSTTVPLAHSWTESGPLLAGAGVPWELHSSVLHAFDEEPGDRVWHLVNAVSAAANLLDQEAHRPPFRLVLRRRGLQRRAMRLCRIATRGGVRAEEFELQT